MYYFAIKEELTLLFNKIDAHKKRSPQNFGVALLQSKARDQAFHIEGLLRLLIRSESLSSKRQKPLLKLLKHAKSLEDALGKMDEVLTLKKIVRAQRRSMDTDSLVHSESAIVHSFAMDTFGSRRWVKKQLKDIRYLKGWGRKKAANITRKTLRNELRKINDKTVKALLPPIESQPFSYDMMELYFHEFRRAVRWVPIYAHSLHEMFGLTPYSLANCDKEESRTLRKYKGNIFTKIQSKNPPLYLDRFAFYMFSHTVARAGLTKDIVEMYYKTKSIGIEGTLKTAFYRKEMVSTVTEFLESGALWRLYDGLTAE